MKKRNITKIEIALEEHEARMVMHCLDYCHHRLTKHKAKGLKDLVRLTRVDKLRKELLMVFNPPTPQATPQSRSSLT